ncbi:2-haloalkanoic acid dehalogenase, partial [Pseudomonas sp. HMWF031]
MGLTEYRALLIDCDEVLVDRDSGVWAALQPLLDSRGGHPDKEQVLAEY